LYFKYAIADLVNLLWLKPQHFFSLLSTGIHPMSNKIIPDFLKVRSMSVLYNVQLFGLSV